MTVYLTSFRRYHAGGTGPLSLGALPGYSITVYQPSWYPRLPKISLFDIRDKKGQWIRPRNFQPPSGGDRLPNPSLLRRYHDELLNMYRERWHNGNNTDIDLRIEDSALCCWCPYDRAAQRQLKDYGSFVCHSWVVETFLTELGVEVVRDADRERMVRL